MRRLQEYPQWLERAYDGAYALFTKLDPLWRRLGHARTGRLLGAAEHAIKPAIFECRMCGQCILHSTGMTCPMTCPKNLRNGPCGGVRADGGCEVLPEMPCVWVQAVERAALMPGHGSEIALIQAPLNHRLAGEPAWLTLLDGRAVRNPQGWIDPRDIDVQPKAQEWKRPISRAVV